MPQIKVGIITFPGSNCDRDALQIFSKHLACHTTLIWHRETIESRYDLLIVPGGFSYGDYLRAGAIARFAPAMQSLVEHRNRGGYVLGICNGFQILTEAGLLPGAFVRNIHLKHICKDTIITPDRENPFLRAMESSIECRIPVSHGEGNYQVDTDTLAAMRQNHQIAFRYKENPNGAIDNIAGITDKEHRVLGMMPHPERATDPLTGGTDGMRILTAVLARVQS